MTMARPTDVSPARHRNVHVRMVFVSGTPDPNYLQALVDSIVETADPERIARYWIDEARRELRVANDYRESPTWP